MLVGTPGSAPHSRALARDTTHLWVYVDTHLSSEVLASCSVASTDEWELHISTPVGREPPEARSTQRRRTTRAEASSNACNPPWHQQPR